MFFESFEALLAHQGHFNDSGRQTLLPRGPSPSNMRVVLCHDMMGGYLDWETDDFGASSLSPLKSSHCFNFHHWNLIDTFIYFSHKRISIPPRGWTAAAHRNGVRVMGTVIVEWDEGNNDLNAFICGEDQTRAGEVIEKLIEIQEEFGFEGWFINIECELDPASSSRLLHWIKSFMVAQKSWSLRTGIKAEIIWYDSVEYQTGKLQWQDCLTAQNSPFFDCTDSIFINYFWRHSQHVLQSALYANPINRSLIDAELVPHQVDRSQKEASDPSYHFTSIPQERFQEMKHLFDDSGREDSQADRWRIFTGLDLFARSRQDGKLDSWKTAQRILEAGTSLAIFAPGWTFETAQSDRKLFEQQERILWDGEVDDKDEDQRKGGFSSVIPFRPSVSLWPFHSEFNDGIGDAFHIESVCVHKGPWVDLSMQDCAVSFPLGPTFHTSFQSTSSLDFDHQTVFSGGSSLCLTINGARGNAVVMRDLFNWDRGSLPVSKDLSVRLVFQVDGLSLSSVWVLCTFERASGERLCVLVGSPLDSTESFVDHLKQENGTSSVFFVDSAPTPFIPHDQISCALVNEQMPKQWHTIETHRIPYLEGDLKDWSLAGVSVVCRSSRDDCCLSRVFLGRISLWDSENNEDQDDISFSVDDGKIDWNGAPVKVIEVDLFEADQQKDERKLKWLARRKRVVGSSSLPFSFSSPFVVGLRSISNYQILPPRFLPSSSSSPSSLSS